VKRVERRRGIVVHVHPVVGLQRGIRHYGGISLVLRLRRLDILRVLHGSRLVPIEEYQAKDHQQGHDHSGSDSHACSQFRGLMTLRGGQFAARLLSAPGSVLGALAEVLPNSVVVGNAVVFGGPTV